MTQTKLPKLVLQEGPLPGQEVNLTGQEVVIGRDPGSGLVVASPSVSRRHARIYCADGQYWVEDLGSSNKTFVNNQAVEAPRQLMSGDILQLGLAVKLTFLLPVETILTEEAHGGPLGGETVQEAIPSAAPDQTSLEPETPRDRTLPAPQLIVTVAGGEVQAVVLIKEHTTLGRAKDNDIVIPSPIVSGHHATIEHGSAGYLLKVLPDATNPIFYQGAPVQAQQPLHDGDILRIGSLDPGTMVTFYFQWPTEAAAKSLTRQIDFGEKDLLQIGRDASNDVILDAPSVSRFHASVERVGQRYRVRDLNSTNGTFVNDQPLQAEMWIKPGDAIRIGPYRFVLGQQSLSKYDETNGLRVEALGLNKWVRKDLNLLKDISLVFQPRDFIVVVGQSGGGKSTLVDALAGYRPATHGRVLVNDVDIYRNFDAIRNEIGFVPQKDIIHTELTVYQALDYAARLRMPADTSKQERHQRVMEVLQDLDLVHRKDVQISGLSGGQQKRVSIGVELLTRPGLFFLDEPSSGLDPGTETALMHLMRRLADQGRTIILITHATKNVMLADKVVFLARGGHLAWFGPPNEALKYFNQYRSERDRRSRSMEFDEIYAVLDDPNQGKAEDWGRRYLESQAYQEYVSQPLQALGRLSPSAHPEPLPAQPAKKADKIKRKNKVSGLSQFFILSSRNFRILTRDRIGLFLMLASAPLVAMLDLLLSFILGRNLFDYYNGNMANVVTTLFQPAIFGIMVGALAMMREFVKESEVYRRERLVNLRVLPYVMSKIWIAVVLALYQAVIYTSIHYIAFKMPGGLAEFVQVYITVALATLAGMSLGLLSSALAPNANAAPLIVILLIIPQVVIGGALIPVGKNVSAVTSTRWAMEALMSITGPGSDVAADACWSLTETERDALTLDDKQARGCRCMGLNALNPNSCNFPGLGAYYDPAIDQAEPQEPAAIGDPPPEPVLPAAPQPPADQSDQKAMAQFFKDLQAYQQEVDQIQSGYKEQVKDYQDKAQAFKDATITYQEDLAEWEINRNTAVSKAEGLINRFHEDFGWAFVNKQDSQAYWSKLVTAWATQAAIIAILFLGILILIYRKDRI